eukprot:6178525-Pleurochrysis_carterae.AAC.1
MRVPRRAGLAEFCCSWPLEARTPLRVGLAARCGSERWGESRARGAGERQGRESSTARDLHWCRSVSCAWAACDAVEPRGAGRMGHPPPAQIRWLRRAFRRQRLPTVSLCEAPALA